MTGRDPEKMLRHEAKRFPIVADLLDRVAYLSDEEINSAPVPLPWYRQALKTVRDRESFRAKMAFMESDESKSFFRHGETPSIKGKQAIYAGPEMWIKMFESDMLLKTNTFVFFPDNGGIWIDCTFGRNANTAVIAQYCKSVMATNLDSYKEESNNRLCALYPDAPMTMNLSAPPPDQNSPMGRLAGLGVRFS